MKYDIVRLAQVAALFFFMSMACIAALLLREYYYFHVRADELVQIKQEYAQYIAAFKRLIHDEEQTTSQEQETTPLGEKKKLANSSFLVVNRDAEYSKKEALAFARQHGLESALMHAYATYERSETVCSPKRRQRIRRSVRKKGTFNAHQQMSHWEHLQKEPIFAWPIDKQCFYVSSPFGPRKYRGVWGFHTGIDMAAVRGTPVAAAGDGIVEQAGFAGGYGNTIVIAHNKKFKTRYAHLAKVLVQKGQRVSAGHVIGKVGDTGNVRKKGRDASHLHFEVYMYGKQVNPFYFLV